MKTNLQESETALKRVLVTGATNGIGEEAALELAEKGCQVIIHGRNPKKIEATVAKAYQRNPAAKVETICADLSSLQEVSRMADELKTRFCSLDVLVNNAGIYSNKKQKSPDGYEITFAVNYLAAFSLTMQTLPLLAHSSSARIINMSSIGHRYVWVNPLDIGSQHFFWSWVNYCRSKLLLIPFTFRLGEFLKNTHITVNALHPGIIIGTEVTNTAFVKWGVPVQHGAATLTNLAMNPDLEEMNGKYVEKYKMKTPSPMAMDKSLKTKLWQQSFLWAGLDQQEYENELKSLIRISQ